MSDLVSLEEAARVAGVTSATIRNWVREGRLSLAKKRNPATRGRRRIMAVALDDLRKLMEAESCE